MLDDATAFSGLVETGERLHAGALSPVALTRAMLDRIAARDGALHAYELVMGESALAEAATAEREIAAGRIRAQRRRGTSGDISSSSRLASPTST